jgi:uncharacterized protein YbjQ (UPF0145 family)
MLESFLANAMRDGALEGSPSRIGHREDCRRRAAVEMESAAADLGANAIVSVFPDSEALGQGNTLMVSVAGTAVVLE